MTTAIKEPDPEVEVPAPPQKEPIQLLWIIIGLVAAVFVDIGIERLVPRY
jgi:hypothetical protein